VSCTLYEAYGVPSSPSEVFHKKTIHSRVSFADIEFKVHNRACHHASWPTSFCCVLWQNPLRGPRGPRQQVSCIPKIAPTCWRTCWVMMSDGWFCYEQYRQYGRITTILGPPRASLICSVGPSLLTSSGHIYQSAVAR